MTNRCLVLSAMLSVATLAPATGATNTSGAVIPPPDDRITFTTLTGVAYSNCVIRRVEPDGLSLMSRKGVHKVLFTEMPEEIRSKFSYDPQKASVYTQELRQRQIAAATAAVQAQHEASLRAAEINRTEAETKFIKIVRRLAIKVRGSVGRISPNGVYIEDAEIASSQREEVTAAGYIPMEGNRVYQTKTEWVPATAKYRDVFVIGGGRGFYDGQKWTGILYPAGLYSEGGSTIKCFSFSAEEAARRMISTRYEPPTTAESE